MHSRSRLTRYRAGRHQRSPVLIVAAILVLASGCEEERNVVQKPKAQASGKAQSSIPAQPEFIVGKRTKEIRNAGPELQKGGARVATTKITADDSITLPGNAYVTTIGRLAAIQIDEAVKLFHATNNRYPRDYKEFMVEIIKANNIALPKLPDYQKYGYDEIEHKLVILEYPALKDQPLMQPSQ
jgi:hypothetical protein